MPNLNIFIYREPSGKKKSGKEMFYLKFIYLFEKVPCVSYIFGV